MTLQPGDTLDLGRCRILRQLGRGGFGLVQQAEDSLLREEVMISDLIPARIGGVYIDVRTPP